MLIKYQKNIVNLDMVTDVVRSDENEKRITFYYPFMQDGEISITFLEFSSKDRRDEAISQILADYHSNAKVCYLED